MRAMQYRIDKSLIILIALVVSSFFPIYYGSVKVEEFVQKRLISDATSIIGSTFDNMAEKILSLVGSEDIVLTLYRNEELRKKIEYDLSLLITPEIKYVYILYRDEEGKFRFLADGSKTDRAEIGEKLDVLNPSEWEEAELTGSTKVIIQDNLYTIGATYIKPLIQNGQVKALLVADFSIKKVQELKATMGVIRNISMGVSLLSLVFLYIAVYQYFKSRKITRSLYVDRLTGLPNRNYVSENFSDINPGDYYIALIDIDDFKKINATFGPDAGDRVIKEVGRFLATKLRDGSIIRYGGEEFLVIIPRKRFTDDAEAILFFDKVRQSFRKFRVKIEDQEISVTVSIGINLSTQREESFESAIEKADRALFRAKRDGKDRVRAFSDRADGLKRRISVSEVMDAIQRGKVICYYQPVVEISSGRVDYYEALARMIDDKREIILPAQFLDDIKDTFAYTKFVKRIIEINTKVLKDHENLRISINLIPTDILDKSIIELLNSIPRGIRERMYLEITEVEGIPSFERVKKTVTKLRKAGFKVGIDDFGAGYSNLINLTQMSIDFLKIDGSIIKDIHKNRTSYLLTRMVNEFCSEMGIKVIAEYVERDKVLSCLQEIGVRYAQGYKFGKPSPLENIIPAKI